MPTKAKNQKNGSVATKPSKNATLDRKTVLKQNEEFWSLQTENECTDFKDSPEKPITFYILTDSTEEGEFLIWGCRLGEELTRQIRAGDVKKISYDGQISYGDSCFFFYGESRGDEKDDEDGAKDPTDRQLDSKAYKKEKVALFGPDYDKYVDEDRKVFKGTFTRKRPTRTKHYIELAELCPGDLPGGAKYNPLPDRFWISKVKRLAKDEAKVALSILCGEEFAEYSTEGEEEDEDEEDEGSDEEVESD